MCTWPAHADPTAASTPLASECAPLCSQSQTSCGTTASSKWAQAATHFRHRMRCRLGIFTVACRQTRRSCFCSCRQPYARPPTIASPSGAQGSCVLRLGSSRSAKQVPAADKIRHHAGHRHMTQGRTDSHPCCRLRTVLFQGRMHAVGTCERPGVKRGPVCAANILGGGSEIIGSASRYSFPL